MIGEVIAFRNGRERAADKTGILLWKGRFDADWLSLKSDVRELEIRAVLTRGFEPPRVAPCAPEAHASASSAT
jgi:hypothetical protein